MLSMSEVMRIEDLMSKVDYIHDVECGHCHQYASDIYSRCTQCDHMYCEECKYVALCGSCIPREIITDYLYDIDCILSNDPYSDDEIEVDIVAYHQFEKTNVIYRRQAKAKAKEISRQQKKDAQNEQFYSRSAREKKAYKRASSKANRRAPEVVNSSRGLNRKIYGDFRNYIEHYYGVDNDSNR